MLFNSAAFENLCKKIDDTILNQLYMLAKASRSRKIASICFNEMFSRRPRDLEIRLELTKNFISARKTSLALFELESIVNSSPLDFQRRPYTYGRLYQQIGLHQKAIACFQRADLENINYVNARFEIGNCFCEMGEYNQGLEEYLKVADIDNTRIDAPFSAVLTLLECREFEPARKLFKSLEIQFRGNPAFRRRRWKYYWKKIKSLCANRKNNSFPFSYYFNRKAKSISSRKELTYSSKKATDTTNYK
jgi:tetratricopeptide (TPR) repeat protein